MSIEEILQECIRRYPIGSIYYGVRDNNPGERYQKSIVAYTPRMYTLQSIIAGYDYLYRDGRFAETDNLEVNNYYEIY